MSCQYANAELFGAGSVSREVSSIQRVPCLQHRQRRTGRADGACALTRGHHPPSALDHLQSHASRTLVKALDGWLAPANPSTYVLDLIEQEH